MGLGIRIVGSCYVVLSSVLKFAILCMVWGTTYWRRWSTECASILMSGKKERISRDRGLCFSSSAGSLTWVWITPFTGRRTTRRRQRGESTNVAMVCWWAGGKELPRNSLQLMKNRHLHQVAYNPARLRMQQRVERQPRSAAVFCSQNTHERAWVSTVQLCCAICMEALRKSELVWSCLEGIKWSLSVPDTILY